MEQLDQRLDNLNTPGAALFMRLDEMDAAMAEHWQDLQVLAALLERMQETDVTELRVIGSILNERIAALQDEVRAMQRDVAAVQEELDVLQGVMGTSEEQINVLTARGAERTGRSAGAVAGARAATVATAGRSSSRIFQLYHASPRRSCEALAT